MTSINEQTLKNSFDRDGYVFLPGFLNLSEVQEIKHRFADYIQLKVSDMPKEHVMYEDRNDQSTLKQMQDLNLYDDYFKKILLDSKFTRIAEQLLDENVIGKTLEYFNKPPRIGKPTPPHQDGYYFMIKPVSAVTMWLALEDVDHENGCISYVRGSHLTGMRTHGRTQTMGFSQAIVDYGRAGDTETAFPAKPGDLLVHHALTIHRAEPNTSADRTRKAMGLIYFGESAREDKEAKAAYQKKLSEELQLKD